MTLLLSRSMYGGQLPTEDKDMCVVFLMNLTVPTVPTVPKVPCKRVFVCWVYVPRPRSLRDARHWQLILWPIPSNMSWSNFVYMYMSYINDSLSLFARADWHRVWKSWWRTGLTSKLLRHMLAGFLPCLFVEEIDLKFWPFLFCSLCIRSNYMLILSRFYRL